MAADVAPTARPADVLSNLKGGNWRFQHPGEMRHPNQTRQRRTDLLNEQRPVAIVLACADSRVSPEIIFDQGLGDLFVLRVAGNVLDDHIMGSIEYGVEKLGVRFILVLGHSNCGAVDATVNALAKGERLPGKVQSLVDAIAPAVQATSGQGVEAAIIKNAQLMAQKIVDSSPNPSKYRTGEVWVCPARYNMFTGEVEFDGPLRPTN
jgi:carbonic anhydrase